MWFWSDNKIADDAFDGRHLEPVFKRKQNIPIKNMH